ncbi:hypothetical protein Tco_0001107 [Tanacetum coccineum]
MVLENDSVVSKKTKEKVKSLALKAKVTREKYSDIQGEKIDLVTGVIDLEEVAEEGDFIGECPKPEENKAFIGRAWSDSEDGNRP